MSRLFLRKSVQDCENDILERGGLKRSLGKWHLTALGVGATIGAGIFATTGTAIVGDPLRPGAGPAIVFSFLLTALTCGFAALCYAEFAAMVPISGSAYTYAYASLGELVAWIIGWDLIIEYAVGNIGVAIGWSGYFRELLSHFGSRMPGLARDRLPLGAHGGGGGRRRRDRRRPPVSRLRHRHGAPPLRLPGHRQPARVPDRRADHRDPGDRHPRESANSNNAMVLLKIGIILFFCAVGATLIKPEQLERSGDRRLRAQRLRGHQRGRRDHLLQLHRIRRRPARPPRRRSDPARDMPFGIIMSLVVCTVLYIVLALVMTGMAPWQQARHRGADDHGARAGRRVAAAAHDLAASSSRSAR